MKRFYLLLLKVDHFLSFRVFQTISDKTLVNFNQVLAQFLHTISETEVNYYYYCYYYY